MEDSGQDSILQPLFVRVHRQSCSDELIYVQREYVEAFYENWVGEFLHPFGDNLHDSEKLGGNLLFCYLAAQSKVFAWLTPTLMCGCYDVVMRELRTVLEGMFTAYYIDIKNPECSLETKMKLLAKLEADKLTFGKKAFKLSGVPSWEAYHATYLELCSYTHLSVSVTGPKLRKVDEAGYPDSLDVHFDKALFVACVQMWQQIARVAGELCVSLMKTLNIECKQTISFPGGLRL
jgi:hypothetical protein